MKLKSLALCLILPFSFQANAGMYGDDLSRCMLESATEEDKIILVRWMFTAMSQHPAINEFSKVKDKQRSKANQEMARLMVELLSVRCLDQAQKAVKFEGGTTIQASFKMLGQMAGRAIFTNPQVAEGIGEMKDFIDSDALNEKLGLKPNKLDIR